METKISIIDGVEGLAVLIGDIRVAGPKAWGGGKVVKEWNVTIKDIVNSLNNIFYPPHQPLKSLQDEIEALERHLTQQCSRQETPVIVGHPPVCSKCMRCHWPDVSCS